LGIKEVYGVDVGEHALVKAKEKRIITFQVDISREKLPFQDETFDFVTLLNIIEHVEELDFTLKEIYRVLKKGGVFLLATPNATSWYNRLLPLFGKPIPGIELSKEMRYRY